MSAASRGPSSLVHRRDFLVGVCGLVGLGLGAALLPDDAVAADGITRLPDGRVSIKVASVAALRSVSTPVLLGSIKSVPTAVLRTGQNQFTALDLRCTHQGVPVRQSGQRWVCPAHGSTFGIRGAVETGPAIASLAVVKSVYDRNSKVLTVG